MKRLDDLEAKRERDAERTGEKYVSRFAGKFQIPGSKESIDKNELRWSVLRHLPANEMLLHVQMKVFPFLKELNGRTSPFTKHMANAVCIMPKASLLVSAINIVEEIFNEIERDTQNVMRIFISTRQRELIKNIKFVGKKRAIF